MYLPPPMLSVRSKSESKVEREANRGEKRSWKVSIDAWESATHEYIRVGRDLFTRDRSESRPRFILDASINPPRLKRLDYYFRFSFHREFLVLPPLSLSRIQRPWFFSKKKKKKKRGGRKKVGEMDDSRWDHYSGTVLFTKEWPATSFSPSLPLFHFTKSHSVLFCRGFQLAKRCYHKNHPFFFPPPSHPTETKRRGEDGGKLGQLIKID